MSLACLPFFEEYAMKLLLCYQELCFQDMRSYNVVAQSLMIHNLLDTDDDFHSGYQSSSQKVSNHLCQG